MNDDWDLRAFVKAASSPPPPIINVAPVTYATDYPFGIPVNEDSFDVNALFHDHDNLCSGLYGTYQQFYGNTIPPPPPPQPPLMNNVPITIPVVSQTFNPPQFEPIVPHQPLPQMMVVDQVQGGAVLDKNIQVQGGPSIQPYVTSSSRVQPLRQKKRKNHIKKMFREMTHEEFVADLGTWRKYGQKPIKGSPHPRNYYRCSIAKGCGARKQVERSITNSEIFVVYYHGEHSHPRLVHRGSLAGNTRNKLTLGGGQHTNNNDMTKTNCMEELKMDSLTPPGSGSNSSPSPPKMLGGANVHRVEMAGQRDDEYENLMLINNLMSDNTNVFTELHDSDQSSGGDIGSDGTFMSPPWTPNEIGDWGVNK